jgi:hypothetical protein
MRGSAPPAAKCRTDLIALLLIGSIRLLAALGELRQQILA